MKKSDKILTNENTALLIIDVQAKIFPVMFESEKLLENTLKLIKGIKVLEMPIYYTEQYPKGLGETIQQIKDELTDIRPIEKMTFSCYGAYNLFERLKQGGITDVIICGIEAHVCVLQTALDLIANGFSVHLPADAVSSRKKFDYKIAIQRMRQHGIEITLTESVLFELLRVCGTDQFKQISKIVK
ncbi:MAG: hydrolase [bacterium]